MKKVKKFEFQACSNCKWWSCNRCRKGFNTNENDWCSAWKKVSKPKIKKKHKEWIDSASYEEMKNRWENTISDEIFYGETGEYYSKVMNEKRKK